MFLQQSRKSALFFLPKQYLERFPKKNHPSHSLAISVYLAFSVLWPLLSRHSGLGLNIKEAILGTRHVRNIPKLYCRIHHRSSGFLARCYGCLGLHTPNMAGSLDYSKSLSVARGCPVTSQSRRTNGVPKSWECRERASDNCCKKQTMLPVRLQQSLIAEIGDGVLASSWHSRVPNFKKTVWTVSLSVHADASTNQLVANRTNKQTNKQTKNQTNKQTNKQTK